MPVSLRGKKAHPLLSIIFPTIYHEEEDNYDNMKTIKITLLLRQTPSLPCKVACLQWGRKLYALLKSCASFAEMS